MLLRDKIQQTKKDQESKQILPQKIRENLVPIWKGMVTYSGSQNVSFFSP